MLSRVLIAATVLWTGYARAQIPPSITVQPTNQTAFVKTGSPNKVFIVGASGSTPLHYQWQRDGTNLNGATLPSLTLSNIQITNAGAYSVVVTNAYGSIVSSNAILTVFDLAASLDATNLVWVTTNNPSWYPQGTLTHDGIAAAIDGVPAMGQVSTLQTSVNGPGTLSFWWLIYNQGPTFRTSLAFLTNNVTLTNMSTPSGWQSMVVYLPNGTQTLKWAYTNIAANGTANGGLVDQVNYSPGGTPATISSGPPDRTLGAGSSTTFAATAFGTPPLTYQWQFNGTNISGATRSSFTIPNVQQVNEGSYGILVTNAFGSNSTHASLTVTSSPPVFTTQPASQTNVVRGNVQFSGAAKGTDPVTYQWVFNGSEIQGATGTSLLLRSLASSQAGNYLLVASNADGVSTSSVAVLTLVSSMIVAWGNNVNGLFNITYGVTNPVGISAGFYHDLALKADGTIVGAGQNLFGEATAPPGLSDVVAVSAGSYFSLALGTNGSITAWGIYGAETNVPPGANNIVAISAGYNNSLALKADGTVLAWGGI